jgi:hypothetical protein
MMEVKVCSGCNFKRCAVLLFLRVQTLVLRGVRYCRFAFAP